MLQAGSVRGEGISQSTNKQQGRRAEHREQAQDRDVTAPADCPSSAVNGREASVLGSVTKTFRSSTDNASGRPSVRPGVGLSTELAQQKIDDARAKAMRVIEYRW